VLTLEEVEEELPATGRKVWPCRRRRRRGRARGVGGGDGGDGEEEGTAATVRRRGRRGWGRAVAARGVGEGSGGAVRKRELRVAAEGVRACSVGRPDQVNQPYLCRRLGRRHTFFSFFNQPAVGPKQLIRGLVDNKN
jgi:hypothetical protein